MFKLKRIYAEPAKDDGTRVLVDRLWPRGVSKPAARLDLWLKDIAPSAELRTWFGHDPQKFAAFAQAYRAELDHNPAVDTLRAAAKQLTVTLLYAAKDNQINHAVILKDYLEQKRAGS